MNVDRYVLKPNFKLLVLLYSETWKYCLVLGPVFKIVYMYIFLSI